MKTEVPSWVAGVVVVLVVCLIGAYLYFGSGPGRQANEMEAAINASVAKPGASGASSLSAGSAGPPTSGQAPAQTK